MLLTCSDEVGANNEVETVAFDIGEAAIGMCAILTL